MLCFSLRVTKNSQQLKEQNSSLTGKQLPHFSLALRTEEQELALICCSASQLQSTPPQQKLKFAKESQGERENG